LYDEENEDHAGTILALDLGKYKSVACANDKATAQAAAQGPVCAGRAKQIRRPFILCSNHLRFATEIQAKKPPPDPATALFTRINTCKSVLFRGVYTFHWGPRLGLRPARGRGDEPG
jgi:hypothetical protein